MRNAGSFNRAVTFESFGARIFFRKAELVSKCFATFEWWASSRKLFSSLEKSWKLWEGFERKLLKRGFDGVACKAFLPFGWRVLVFVPPEYLCCSRNCVRRSSVLKELKLLKRIWSAFFVRVEHCRRATGVYSDVWKQGSLLDHGEGAPKDIVEATGFACVWR